MKQLLVISGKGGTGKTTLTASFAALGKELILADCDVDAADLHLLLHPKIQERYDFIGGLMPELDSAKCRQCFKCVEACRYQAIDIYPDLTLGSSKVSLNPLHCEGCTLCQYVCPNEAIQMKDHQCGHWFHSETRFGPMIHASLGIGEENSGKLVSQVLTRAREVGEAEGKEILLIDGPPGIGCPVISSFSGTDLVLIVTEPTVSGWHDLQRVLDLAEHFQISALVCINKADLAEEVTQKIKNYCTERHVKVVGAIPFDRQIPETLSQGKIPVEEDLHSSHAIRDTFAQVIQELQNL